MAVTTHTAPAEPPRFTRKQIALFLLGLAVLFALARPVLPLWFVERPDDSGVFPFAVWLDAFFNFLRYDLGLEAVTRWLASNPLKFLLDASANLLEGKRRWPHLGPIPWPAVAATAAVLGYWLGGWRLALLGGGTFVWVALIGQWKIAMQTMAVIVVAAPIAFFLGLGLGILAWKYRSFENAIKPILAILQTLPFFTYLLPAVIFFIVGPTAAAVATIVYAIPPMVL
ncbi:MAG: glycine/betaine ABC transporter permease, partial [Pseudomonadota bacterium]